MTLARKILLAGSSLVGLLALWLVVGCGSVKTNKGFYQPITAELRAGNYDSVLVQVEQAHEKGKWGEKDRFVYYVDAGLANHYAGRFDSSNVYLSQAEIAAEELYTKSVSRAVASMLLNDNVLEYAGEDFEILYTNIMMCLNYLQKGDYEGAFVEVRRANQKLDVLEDKYTETARAYRIANQKDSTALQVDYEPDEVRYYNNAFARYLSMHMYAAEGSYDDARIDYDLLVDAFASQPEVYDYAMPEVLYRSENHALLSVVGLAGLGPIKEEFSLRLRTDKDLNLIQIVVDDEHNPAEYGHIPAPINTDLYFKFAIPKIVERPTTVNKIEVWADSTMLGELQLIDDVYKIAEETFRAKKSLIYLRTVVRAVAKAITASKAKKKADTGGLGGWLKKAAIDVATDISENPDLRTAQFLPGRVYVGDFEVEPGTYNLRVEFYDQYGQLLKRAVRNNYTVRERGFNLIESFFLN